MYNESFSTDDSPLKYMLDYIMMHDICLTAIWLNDKLSLW